MVRKFFSGCMSMASLTLAQMTNLSKSLREKLSELCEIRVPTIIKDNPSVDGTRKWLFQLADGNCIETVYIPESTRGYVVCFFTSRMRIELYVLLDWRDGF